MTPFNWDIEIEQEPFTCPCCGHNRYKPVSTETNKKRPKITIGASGLIKISNRKFIDVQIIKDFAECVLCRNRILLNKSEKIVLKETKKEIADRLAKTKFDREFLNPGVL